MSVTDSDYRIVHIWGLKESIALCLLTLKTTHATTVKSMLPIPSQVSSSAACSQSCAIDSGAGNPPRVSRGTRQVKW